MSLSPPMKKDRNNSSTTVVCSMVDKFCNRCETINKEKMYVIYKFCFTINFNRRYI